jgi:branched-chain amino acid aminotransferase
MHFTCYLNGQYIPLNTAGLPIGDLGVQRGYGIFDFVRVTENVPLYLDDHLDRFYRSAEHMRLDIGKTRDELKRAVRQLLIQNKLPDSGLRILLTGGVSTDGYSISQSNLAIIQSPLPPPPVVLPAAYKLASYPYQREMPQVKTTNYLMAVWLQPWLKEQGADDILYQKDGLISECPRSNFFLVMKDDTVVTPGSNILNGITKKQLLQLADANGIRMEERDVHMNEIPQAKAAFISSSTKRIIPVRQVDDHVFETGNSAVSIKLFELLQKKENALIAERAFQ